MIKIKVGDVFEIETKKGKAYVQYIYDGKTDGDLIRVLPGLYNEEPLSIEDLVQKDELFLLFFPLKHAVKLSLLRFVKHLTVHKKIAKPRYMRTPHIIQGNFLGWHIVDTGTLMRRLVQNLSKDEIKLSPWGLWNDTLLKDRLEQGWTLDQWI